MCPEVKQKIQELRELAVRFDVMTNELIAMTERPPMPMYPTMHEGEKEE